MFCLQIHARAGRTMNEKFSILHEATPRAVLKISVLKIPSNFLGKTIDPHDKQKMLFLPNELAKKAEITILPARDTTRPGSQAGVLWVVYQGGGV